VRPPIIRAALERDLVVDNFAGGGGASTGIAAALGRDPDIAINHSPEAIAVHRANHPATKHYLENVWDVDPAEACAGRPVGLAWFSPDCTHHSRAKGGKPRKKKIRGLAWVVTRWARAVRPRVIVVENVEEFESWGPLNREGHPVRERAGETFRAWVAKLRSYGYRVEWRSLVAADFGAPTTRRRLFLVGRCDGLPIVWPEPTHGRGRALAWRPAADVIDWSLPCPSIFERARPLADATLRRIAEGVRRYVLEAAQPFIVRTDMQSDGRLRGIGGLAEPLRTVTSSGGHALVAPTLIQTGYGEREGQTPRVPGLEKPLGTVVAGGQKHALVAALVTKHYGGVVGHEVGRPLGTITTQDHHSVTAAFLTKFYGTSTGSDVRTPVPTMTAGGGRGGGHLAEVRAFLLKYYGGERGDRRQQALFEPLHTVTTARRFGLVLVQGEPYEIADIGMRMLSPRELFRAQGFPEAYVIAPEHKGKPLTKTAQIALAGNSVPPQLAEAIVRANVCPAFDEARTA
jgi:DNA (cytosine-5)-methyltransferase 1